MKRLIRKSLSIGASVTAGLILVEFLFAEVAALRHAGEEIALLLYPGTALMLALGNNRMDDVGFWGVAMIVNWLLYSSVCFLVLWLIDRRNVRSEKDGSK
jgi:hypothetical protein